MNMKTTLVMVAAGTLLAFTAPARGQEVNSDVNIPLPRELVSGAPAINGLFVGPDSLFRAPDQIFRGSLAEASVGILNELATREEVGEFMTSLMVRAGIIAFDRLPVRLAGSESDSKDGSRPAWTGPTPVALSVSRGRRSDSARPRR